MIRLSEVPLPADAAARLKHWQRELDGLPTYAERIERARALFKSRNSTSNPTFRVVRETLAQMCCGPERCIYCEDSAAHEVEHIAPKAWFPDLAFVWTNYLFSCGACNRPKGSRHAVLDDEGRTRELRRGRNEAVVPPPAGTALLVNPRDEDPLAFFEMDLAGPNAQFLLLPRREASPEMRIRARWTIDALSLNRRPVTRMREAIFHSHVCRLENYASRKAGGEDGSKLDKVRQRLLEMPHPTVFREMQRQFDLDPRLLSLFEPIPEALTW